MKMIIKTVVLLVMLAVVFTLTVTKAEAFFCTDNNGYCYGGFECCQGTCCTQSGYPNPGICGSFGGCNNGCYNYYCFSDSNCCSSNPTCFGGTQGHPGFCG